MKRLLTLACVLAFAQQAAAQTATEKAEKRLADLLAPGSGAAAALTTKPIVWRASSVVTDIGIAVKPVAPLPVRLPLPPRREVKPKSPPEGTALLAFRDPSKAPAEIELPTKPLIRLPSVDVNAPLAIPILGQPLKDRASLGDPALEASRSAALRPFAPTRDRPLPFVPLNLPDPFENLRYGQMRNPPEENATPPAIPLTKPK